MKAIKIYVVISDPDFYRQYETVFLDLEKAKQYILDAEDTRRKPYDSTGRWVEETHSDANGAVTLCWGYPGYGNSYGICTEEVSSEDAQLDGD